MQRSRFILEGVLRPFLAIVPSLLLYPFWRKLAMVPAQPVVLVLWAIATAAIAYWAVLSAADRQEGRVVLQRLFFWRRSRASVAEET
jgi:hypothetical protein